MYWVEEYILNTVLFPLLLWKYFLASSVEIFGGTMTSSPFFQFTGVATDNYPQAVKNPIPSEFH
jgi:hypothetical protein